MSPVKKLRLQGDTRGGRTRLGLDSDNGYRIVMLAAPQPPSAAHLQGDRDGDVRTVVTDCSTLFNVPHSYFFFWAFSAALVILPVVTSLKVTL